MTRINLQPLNSECKFGLVSVGSSVYRYEYYCHTHKMMASMCDMKAIQKMPHDPDCGCHECKGETNGKN